MSPQGSAEFVNAYGSLVWDNSTRQKCGVKHVALMCLQCDSLVHVL